MEIFDGKLSFNDITNMDLSLLNEMRSLKEDELEKKAKEIKRIKEQQNKISK